MSDPAALSEAPESDSEADKEISDLADASRERLARDNAQLARTVTEVQATISELTVGTFNADALETAQTRRVVDPKISSNDPVPNPRWEAARKNGQAIIDKAAKQSGKDREWNAKRYAGRFMALAISAGAIIGLIYELASRRASGTGASDIPVDESLKDKVDQVVDQWRAESDDDYWKDFADYLDASPMTIADQIYFVNYTSKFFQLLEPWFWDSSVDEINLVTTLTDAVKGKAPSELYRQVITLRYKDQPLPRAVAAEVLYLALSWE